MSRRRAMISGSYDLPFSRISALAVLIFDGSLFKTFKIKNSLTLRLRAEAFNFVNNPWFGAPGITLDSAAFGSTSNRKSTTSAMPIWR
jgi:hypothetical protein